MKSITKTLPNEHDAKHKAILANIELFDRMTSQGFKLNFITEKFYKIEKKNA